MRLCLRRSACRHCCLREASYSGRRCRCTRIGLINLLLLSVCDSTSTLGVAKFTAIHVALRHIIKETKMFTKFTKPQEKKNTKKQQKILVHSLAPDVTLALTPTLNHLANKPLQTISLPNSIACALRCATDSKLMSRNPNMDRGKFISRTHAAVDYIPELYGTPICRITCLFSFLLGSYCVDDLRNILPNVPIAFHLSQHRKIRNQSSNGTSHVTSQHTMNHCFLAADVV